VTQIQPEYAEAYYTLGTVYKQMKKYPESAEALRKAIELQPELAGAHTTLASVLRQLGDNESAEAESKAGAQLSQEKTSLQAATFATNSGKRLLANGDLDGAISQFRAAISSVPTYALAHYQLAVALAQQGHKDEAATEFQKASELDSHLVPPH
jgi:tetratricopeptide (TPR) repeat protein